MIVEIDQSVPVSKSYADERTRGLYNVEAEDGSRFQLKVQIPVDGGYGGKTDWQIGMVVGPSGSGKSSILRALEEKGWDEYEPEWGDETVIGQLSRMHKYEKATAAMSAVGLGSVPSWLRPRKVLSMGEGFRADLAQLLLSAQVSSSEDVMIDEFTSVLDRQVAKVGAGAFARAWRRTGKRIILFTCHYDVLEWVQPDWWLDTADGLNEFAEDRGVIRPQVGTFPAAADRPGYQGDRVGTLEC